MTIKYLVFQIFFFTYYIYKHAQAHTYTHTQLGCTAWQVVFII